MQSHVQSQLPRHVAIIMDGNGRWATRRGLPRAAGHRAGAGAVRRVVEQAGKLGIGTLTLFAFSSDNWSRPPAEVSTLMGLVGEYLRRETQRLAENDVRLQVIGRRDRLGSTLRRAIREAERRCASGRGLHLRIALDYSGRDAIARAARRFARAAEPSLELFGRLLAGTCRDGPHVPEVDLMIRTGGERRLSDFLLWECAYAELHFTDCMWPDFRRDDLGAALRDFAARERRFGGLPAPAPARAAQSREERRA